MAAEPSSAAASADAAAPKATLEPFAAELPPLAPLPVLDAGPLDPATLAGKVVLVHFFATWCEPCREELPALARLAADHPTALAIVAVDVGEVDVRVRRFLAGQPLPFPVTLDRDRAFTKAWGISALPNTIVLDPTLRPRLRATGDVAWDTSAPRAALAALFSLPPAPPGAPLPGPSSSSGDPRP